MTDKLSNHPKQPSLRKWRTGSSLLELMTIIVIVVVLAAMAIPTYGRYLKRAETSEAILILDRLYTGAVVYYQTDHTSLNGGVLAPQFPTTVASTPGETPTSMGYDSDPATWDHPTWKALHFSITGPHTYQYTFARIISGIQLCKVPPGNPSNAHQAYVGAPAVQRHLDEGSYLGECQEEPPEDGGGEWVEPPRGGGGDCSDVGTPWEDDGVFGQDDPFGNGMEFECPGGQASKSTPIVGFVVMANTDFDDDGEFSSIYRIGSITPDGGVRGTQSAIQHDPFE